MVNILYFTCPSNLVTVVVDCFHRSGQNLLVMTTLSEVSVWTSDDTDFESAPLQLRTCLSLCERECVELYTCCLLLVNDHCV
jgi:hypothetical protein